MNARLLPYSPERDVYRLLGVAPNASMDEIAAACRHLARTFHPDRNGSLRATQEMQIVNAVREVMTDPASREAYDRERWRFHARVRPAQPMLSGGAGTAALSMRPPVWERYLRAAGIGIRTVVLGLAPPRCGRCRIVVEGGDVYCAACGTPLLEGGR